MSRLDDQLKQAKELAEREREQAEKELKAKITRMSLELAKRGAEAQDEEHYTDAIKAFQSYLQLLENYKKVKRHGLTPQLFDKKKDVMEILLISGIYWDLAKIYDKSRKPNMFRDFKIYIQKFVIFAKGQPFTPLCAEQLRKYIDNDKPLHTSEFKTAYTALTGKRRCFVATVLEPECEPLTLHRLWNFRDLILAQSFFGRGIIWLYDVIGPVLASGVRLLPQWQKTFLGKRLSQLSFFLDRLT